MTPIGPTTLAPLPDRPLARTLELVIPPAEAVAHAAAHLPDRPHALIEIHVLPDLVGHRFIVELRVPPYRNDITLRCRLGVIDRPHEGGSVLHIHPLRAGVGRLIAVAVLGFWSLLTISLAAVECGVSGWLICLGLSLFGVSLVVYWLLGVVARQNPLNDQLAAAVAHAFAGVRRPDPHSNLPYRESGDSAADAAGLPPAPDWSDLAAELQFEQDFERDAGEG